MVHGQKLVVQLENWSDNYDNNVGDYKIDLTELYIENGKCSNVYRSI